MDLKKLIQTHLRDFKAYTPGEQPNDVGWIKLNTNENPYPPIPEILNDIKNAVNQRIRLYPDPSAREVRKKIVTSYLNDFNTVDDTDKIFVGNGTDDVLEVVFKLLIEPGDDVVYFDPSYGMYDTLTELYGGNCIKIPLGNNFSFPDEVFDVEGKLLIINSPNNPTGQSFDNHLIQRACESFPGIVFVDETYADFSKKSVLPLLKKVDNLIVSRSFSKSFSLASLRIGLAISDKKIISLMNSVKLPYNVNYLAQIAAISCIEHSEKVFENNQKIITERKRIRNNMEKFNNISILPSDSNFLLIKFEEELSAREVFEKLKEKKILVRFFDKPGLVNYIRVSIGTKEENNQLLKEFEKIVKKHL